MRALLLLSTLLLTIPAHAQKMPKAAKPVRTQRLAGGARPVSNIKPPVQSLAGGARPVSDIKTPTGTSVTAGPVHHNFW